jgi:hypothetical protein
VNFKCLHGTLRIVFAGENRREALGYRQDELSKNSHGMHRDASFFLYIMDFLLYITTIQQQSLI